MAEPTESMTAGQLRWRLLQQEEHSAYLARRVRTAEAELARILDVELGQRAAIVEAAVEMERTFREGPADACVRAQDAVMDAVRRYGEKERPHA